MSASQWNRTLAPAFGTFNDIAEAMVFNENAIDMPAGFTGELEVLDSEIAQPNTWIEAECYIRSALSFPAPLMVLGSRIDTVNNNDGYYAGFGQNGSFQLTGAIYKRSAGVLTELAETARLDTGFNPMVVDSEIRFIFITKGTKLELRVEQADSSLIQGIIINDSTFSNSGTANILKYQGGSAGKDLRLDKFAVYNVL